MLGFADSLGLALGRYEGCNNGFLIGSLDGRTEGKRDDELEATLVGPIGGWDVNSLLSEGSRINTTNRITAAPRRVNKDNVLFPEMMRFGISAEDDAFTTPLILFPIHRCFARIYAPTYLVIRPIWKTAYFLMTMNF